MHHAEHGVAVAGIGHQHPKSAQILDLIKTQVLGAHLVIDAVQMLRASADFGDHTSLPQRRAQSLDRTRHELLALEAPLFKLACNPAIELGLDKAKGQILKLPLELTQTQAISQRREHFEGLAGHRGRRRCPGAGMVAQGLQARSQPDQHHADVARHGQCHSPQGL